MNSLRWLVSSSVAGRRVAWCLSLGLVSLLVACAGDSEDGDRASARDVGGADGAALRDVATAPDVGLPDVDVPAQDTCVPADLPLDAGVSDGADLRPADADTPPHDGAPPVTDAGSADPDCGPEPGFPGVEVVDPFLGTGAFGAGVGSTLPGATLPFGLAKVSPDTRGANGARVGALHCAGYRYEDELIEGFSHTHVHGTGVADYGALLLTPALDLPAEGDPARTNEDGYSLPFSHATEQAWPGYYQVDIGEPAVRVELTASEHGARHRYTFPAQAQPGLVLDLGHALGDGRVSASELRLDPAQGRIEGELITQGSLSGRYGGQRFYFSARLDPAWAGAVLWQDAELQPGAAGAAGERVGAQLRFEPPQPGAPLTVQVAVGVSFVDVQGARANLEAELPGWDFEASRVAAEQAWAEALGRVEVSGGTPEQLEIFYTALYHVLQMPTLLSDVDSRYRGFDGRIHRAEGFRYYSDFSLWDTYRTQHPLLTLLYPERQRDMILSLVRMYEQGGAFPRWPLGTGYTHCMVGSSAEIVVADSWLKGVTDFDLRHAYEGLKLTADGPMPPGSAYHGRSCVADYLELGYCASDRIGGSVSRTLEYAYDDFALAQIAAALGDDDDEARYRARALSYRNVWDDEVRFFRGRRADGSFPEAFEPLGWASEFTEGDAWHYRFFVPHDVDGLIELFRSRRALVRELDTFFEEAVSRGRQPLPDPYYWHGNEPDIHAAWVYVDAGRPERTQRYTRWILSELYRTGPDGLVGNDDAGTLSAWYVFAALGFYPLPATDRYTLGSPIFSRARLSLPSGPLELHAPGTSASDLYVQSAQLDDQPLDQAWLTHAALTGAARLTLRMGPEPSEWGRVED